MTTPLSDTVRLCVEKLRRRYATKISPSFSNASQLINPDGLEAANLLIQLEEENGRLREALEVIGIAKGGKVEHVASLARTALAGEQ